MSWYARGAANLTLQSWARNAEPRSDKRCAQTSHKSQGTRSPSISAGGLIAVVGTCGSCRPPPTSRIPSNPIREAQDESGPSTANKNAVDETAAAPVRATGVPHPSRPETRKHRRKQERSWSAIVRIFFSRQKRAICPAPREGILDGVYLSGGATGHWRLQSRRDSLNEMKSSVDFDAMSDGRRRLGGMDYPA